MQLGKYEIIKELGRGGFGIVYLAKDMTLNREVALKVLHPQLAAEANFMVKFRQEAQMLAKLEHPNIVPVHEFNEIDGRSYIAMRYVDGISLDQYLQQYGPLPWKQVVLLVKQIGSAIAYAHKQQLLHRDIKPNNILFSKKGEFVLTDFGLTRAMQNSGSMSTSGSILGTPPYIPPEIWNGKEASPLSDQYSFACVVHEAITGKVLFSGTTAQEIIAKHLVNKPEIGNYPTEIPQKINHIIKKALSKDAKDRFKDIEAFTAAIEFPESFDVQDYLAKLSVADKSAADKVAQEKAARVKRRKGCFTAGLITFVVAVMALGIVYAVNKDRIRAKVADIFGLQAETTLATSSPDASEEVSSIETNGDGPVNKATDNGQPTLEVNPVLTYLPTYIPTSKPTVTQLSTNTPTATPAPTLTPTSTSTPTPTKTNTAKPTATRTLTQLAVNDDVQVPIGSGVEITQIDNGTTALAAYFLWGDGSPKEGQYVEVFTQKKDLSGNWITDKRLDWGNTDNSGSVTFNVETGEYIIATDFRGYNWGNASDVEGQVNIAVEVGKTTQIVLRLGILRIGFVYADGTMVESQYVEVYKQRLSVAGEWVEGDSVGWSNTDNSGEVFFDLTAGNYTVKSEFRGYNWGDAKGLMGEANVGVKPGQLTQIVVNLGRLVVALKDNSENPIDGGYVELYFQTKDVNGNPAAGKSITWGNTDNTGTVGFTLTAGKYVIKHDDTYYYNIDVIEGMTTTTDGITTTFAD